MFKKYFVFACIFLSFGCKETVFNSGLENRLTAIIDMAPETYSSKVDFTSDEQVGGCEDSEFVYIDQWEDGSSDNTYYTIKIDAKDYFKSQNNCNEWGWEDTSQELVMHELRITAYVNEISNNMYIAGSHFSDHPGYPTNVIDVYYKLVRDEDGQTNNESGIEYYGFDAELEIVDLNLSEGIMSGTFNATLYRGTPIADGISFMGVDNFPNLDLYNPSINDPIGDIDGDGFGDYHLTDSIRIENCVFQRITVNNNVP